MEGMGRLPFSDLSQNCQFHHRRLESLERSLRVIRSVTEQAVGSREHYSRCAHGLDTLCHWYMVSSSENLNFFMFDLHRNIFILILLKHYHLHQGSDEPTANDSEGVSNSLSVTDFMCSVQVDTIVYCGDCISGSTAYIKLFLDFFRFAGGI